LRLTHGIGLRRLEVLAEEPLSFVELTVGDVVAQRAVVQFRTGAEVLAVELLAAEVLAAANVSAGSKPAAPRAAAKATAATWASLRLDDRKSDDRQRNQRDPNEFLHENTFESRREMPPSRQSTTAIAGVSSQA
jgi:hypothetical protein